MPRRPEQAKRKQRKPRNPFFIMARNLERLGVKLEEVANRPGRGPHNWGIVKWDKWLRDQFFDVGGDFDLLARAIAAAIEWNLDRDQADKQPRGKYDEYRRATSPYLEITNKFVEAHRDFLTEQMLLGKYATKTAFTDLMLYDGPTLFDLNGPLLFDVKDQSLFDVTRGDIQPK